MKKVFVILLQLVVVANAYAGIKKASIIDPVSKRRVEVVEGELLVKFRHGTDKAVMSMTNKNLGGRKKSEIKHFNIHCIKIPAGKTIEEMIELYKNNPDVEFAQPNYIRRAFKNPDDPKFVDGSQWGLHDSSDNDMDAPEAWDIETGTSGVVIAVIDSGINYNHEDLDDNMWENAGEMGGGKDTNSIDDDGNGKVDDWRGWDFADSDNDPMDVYGHGTEVSGAMAAEGNNATGVSGVAWDASIMNVRVLNEEGEATSEELASGIIYAADNGADIINLSLGGASMSPVEKVAIDSATASGCLIIAATGNENKSSISYPAGHDDVFAVGASNEDDERCDAGDWGSGYGSNYGEGIDVVAPGHIIWTTKFVSSISITGYDYASGTSLATPLVSGLAALMKSRYGDSLTNDEIKDMIRNTCDDIDDLGYDLNTGYGRANAYGALGAESRTDTTRQVSAANYPNPFLPSRDGFTTVFFTTSYENSPEKLTVYTISGEQVFRTNEMQLAEVLKDGQRMYECEWDGNNDRGNPVATGIYFFVVETESTQKSGKITLIR